MKFLSALLLTLSFSSFAAETVELSQAECVRQCEVYSYGFQRDFFGNCQQIEKCDVLSRNESAQSCEIVALDELVVFPIACRDIPAL